MLIPLKFRQYQFLTDFIVANAQLLNLLVCHMYLPTGFKIDAVDDAVRVDVFAVGVRADQHFAALEVPGKLPRRFVGCARVNICAAWEALYHVVEHHTTVLVVQQLCTQKLIERCFRLTANAADELLSIPERFIYL